MTIYEPELNLSLTIVVIQVIILETFETNFKNYVRDLDSNTEKFWRKTQILEGCNPEIFQEVFVKRKKFKDDFKDDDDIDNDNEDYHFTFSIINPDMKKPWYCSKAVLIISTLLAIRQIKIVKP